MRVRLHPSLPILPLLLVLLAGCDAAEESPDVDCFPGEVPCAGVCTDTETDARHCGACGASCEQGQVCIGGSCVQGCGPEEALCDGSCVDLRRSPAHCGACGAACEEGEVCVAGACAPPCGEGLVACDERCVDVSRDADHCGGCGLRCSDERMCEDGKCVCKGGEEDCGGSCVDTRSDPANCGACGTICGAEEVCSQGACKPDCDVGLSACDGACVDTDTAASHCGACGNACPADMNCELGDCACPAGQDLCEGACVDLQVDPANCGFCGTVCGDGKSCIGGACKCAPTEVECDGICIDPASDPLHCGGCDKRCSIAEHATEASTCELGSCAFACEEGWADCGPAEGCETDILSDAMHCGACNNPCLPGARCEEGACVCPDGNLVCGAACIDVTEDLVNCGACSKACRADQLCADSTCVCPEGRTECSDACVSLATDMEHCGGCGVACRADQLCTGGTCVCPADKEACDDACIDTRADSENCGGCGNKCDADRTCTNSKCVCVWPALECDGACTNVSEDPNHCGNCNVQCRPDQECRGGCVCPAGFQECGGECVPAGECPDACPGCAVGCERERCLGAIDFDGGGRHSCAVNTEGQVWCWGDNSYGQLGDPKADASSARPVLVEGLEGVAQVALGEDHSCALTKDMNVYCWGRGENGRLGSGEEDRPEPTHVEAVKGVTQIVAGRMHTCALTDEMNVWCWGYNANGQLGDPNLSESVPEPVMVMEDPSKGSPLESILQIAASESNTCALHKEGRVLCWGAGDQGQNGDGQGRETAEGPAVEVLISDEKGERTLEDARFIAGGIGPHGHRQCAIFGDLQVACWGDNQAEALGAGHGGATSLVALPTQAEKASQVVTGSQHTCVLQEGDGTVHCWGNQELGRVGNGQDRGMASKPEMVLDESCRQPLEGVERIGRGHDHTCAITKDQQLFCWGSNGEKQLGDNPDGAFLCARPLGNAR